MLLQFSHLGFDGSVVSQNILSEDIETLFDILSQFVAEGYTLISACVVDEVGRRTDLPIEAFDSEPIEKYVRNLTVEYQQVLSS
ncbi:hypothetical protein ACS5NO_20685 [Larkinella sp. GY13]|uniref:hypothetical protein n=1 Tax=Larkinella sp. GY13 TaxID=3453720 RepID=UPI003EEEF365